MAGKKLYKLKFTHRDIMLIQDYIRKNGSSLCVEIRQNDNDDGDVYEIHPINLACAIRLTDKYYDNVVASKKVVELLLREKNGEYTCIYHVEKNRSGITYEILEYANRGVHD